MDRINFEQLKIIETVAFGWIHELSELKDSDFCSDKIAATKMYLSFFHSDS